MKLILSAFLIFCTTSLSWLAYTQPHKHLILTLMSSMIMLAPIAFAFLMMLIWMPKMWHWITIGTVCCVCAYALLFTHSKIPQKASDAIRLATFNMFYATPPSPRVAADIDADILSLIEVNHQHADMIAALKKVYPHSLTRESSDARSRMVLLSRWPLEKKEAADDYVMTAFVGAPMPFTLHQVHTSAPVTSASLKRRNNTLQQLTQQPTGHNTVWFGDFNMVPWDTPFKAFLKHHRATLANNGALTWPRPLPLVSIDHIVLSQELTTLQSGKHCKSSSDHCAVWADVAVKK